MDVKIQKVLDIWHNHFNNIENQYSEFEDSDIEYFVGCMLYNHFNFSKAHHNLKTIDLSYDFLTSCGDQEYEEIKAIIDSIVFENELDSLKFLQDYIDEVKGKYTKTELYLLDRLSYHVNSMSKRYEEDVDVKHIDFTNPLLRK